MTLIQYSRALAPSASRAARVTAASMSLLRKSGLHFEEITVGHFHVAGGFIHILVVLALIPLIINLVAGRSRA